MNLVDCNSSCHVRRCFSYIRCLYYHRHRSVPSSSLLLASQLLPPREGIFSDPFPALSSPWKIPSRTVLYSMRLLNSPPFNVALGCQRSDVEYPPPPPFLHFSSTGVDFKSKTLRCQEAFKGTEHEVDYDSLVIATGAQNNTFGVPGVSEV